MSSPISKKALTTILALTVMFGATAHTTNYALENAPVNKVVWFYTKLGFEHIVPMGIDHILFVISLCLLSTNLKTMLWQATAFTVAHSITLALSMKNVVVLPAGIVEPIIALSIAFVAIENIILQKLMPARLLVVFLFGLIHGLGFATALNEIGLPTGKFYTALIAFNVGVELGQAAVIAAMFGLLIFPFRNRSWFRKGIVIPFSVIIALIALYWTFQRVFTGI
ncbi:MAG: HupE/UreJ family protein [Ferruginibacter sp.]|nr:HupE/UreJ family protein [Ferruginibacter sp.]